MARRFLSWGAATLISYLTPPVATAGLYRGLIDLKSSLERWRRGQADEDGQHELAELIQIQARELDLNTDTRPWTDPQAAIIELSRAVAELETTLIPDGLHVVGEPMAEAARIELLMAMAESAHGHPVPRRAIEALVRGATPEAAARTDIAGNHLAVLRELARHDECLRKDTEIEAIVHALDGCFVPAAPGGDVLRTPAVLPTGRNVHGFDPFGIPSRYAIEDGRRQAERLLARHIADGNALPETIAMVLWGTDNLKSEGGPIAQALALIGATPRHDSYGRMVGAALIPLEALGRPRIDVVMTMSGIFRDLLPLQIKLLADAALLAAQADEPLEQNFVRKHALEYQRANGCDLESAALRVFGNADGAYGANVNNLMESGRWDVGDELAETYTRRKCFAFGRAGTPVANTELLNSILAKVEFAYQNLDSVELGVTTIDNYFDTLGGISQAVRRARGGAATPVYIGDQTRGEGKIRTLTEQVALETRTRVLNPKWYEGMLKHGYEGVRQIDTHIANTLGWSATTGQVDPWVYQRLSQTYVLDEAMRKRLEQLNPTASAKVANRLIEAQDRGYWTADPETLAALRLAADDMEDQLEGIGRQQASLEVAA